MKIQRVQLNRWVLPETLEYLNQQAKTRGFKQGPMLDRVVQEYDNPSITYLLDKLVQKLPEENYFTDAEKKQLAKLKEILESL